VRVIRKHTIEFY